MREEPIQVIKAEDRLSAINKEPCELASYKSRSSRYKDCARFTRSDLPVVRKLSRFKPSALCNGLEAKMALGQMGCARGMCYRMVFS